MLELGCGTGQVTAELAACGAKVVAVDRSSTMLDRARRRAPTAEFLKGDVIDRDTEGGFDAVVLAFVLHELVDDGGADRGAVSGPRRPLDPTAASASSTGRSARGMEAERVAPPDHEDRAERRVEVLVGCLPDDLQSAGLVVTPDSRALAGERASMLLAARR